MTELTITQARKALLDLSRRLAKDSKKTVSITRHGRPVLALMPWDLYEGLVETLEVLGDPDTTSALRVSVEDVRKGRLVSHATARRRLGYRAARAPARDTGVRGLSATRTAVVVVAARAVPAAARAASTAPGPG